MTDQTPVTFPWRTDFENAPSPCIGWCTPPAGDDVRQIWRHSHLKGQWTAHSITQTVKAWQPLPSIGNDGGVAQQPWQPIETAPKDGTKIDLWHPTKGRCVNAFWQRLTSILYEPSCWSNQSWGRIVGATHWMPVPADPSNQGASK